MATRLKLTPGQQDAVLDVFESCREVKAAYEQYHQRGRPAKTEYLESVRHLSSVIEDAEVKNVPEVMLRVLVHRHVPKEVWPLV